jgi:hypothetical protein
VARDCVIVAELDAQLFRDNLYIEPAVLNDSGAG